MSEVISVARALYHPLKARRYLASEVLMHAVSASRIIDMMADMKLSSLSCHSLRLKLIS